MPIDKVDLYVLYRRATSEDLVRRVYSFLTSKVVEFCPEQGDLHGLGVRLQVAFCATNFSLFHCACGINDPHW